MSEIQNIKALLQARILDVIQQLQIEGHKSGQSWIARSPWRADRNGGSFAIYINGTKAGGWRDFATDESGDVFHLISGCLTGQPRDPAGVSKALTWARDFLGLAKMDASQRDRMQAKIATARAAMAKTEAAEQAKLAAIAKKHFFGRCTPIEGTLADTYLWSRGILLGNLKRVPFALRFDAAAKHTETKTILPAMVAGMNHIGGDGLPGVVCALHRTFLAHDGYGKAPVTPSRKMWPSVAGCVIQLARGEHDMPVAEAAKHGLLETLCLVEGIEDGLTVAMARPDWRVWAVASLSNLARVRMPPTAGDVVICADNDWGKPQAQIAFQKGVQAIARQVPQVRVARSGVGKDFNDQLNASRGCSDADASGPSGGAGQRPGGRLAAGSRY